MTSSHVLYVALSLTALGVALGVFAILRGSVREILRNLSGIEGVATFYERVLLLGLVLTSVGWALDASFGHEEDAHFMDYLWDYADGLADVLVYTALFAGAFAVLLTVLISALGRRRDG